MAYCTTFQVSEYSGLALKIVDENVGTGNSSNTHFFLDNKNIVNGSYTFSYGASGTTTRTALTETTHYTTNLEAGLITLTATGVTAVGTNVIFANYRYWTEEFNDSTISNFIITSDDEIEQITGRKWDTPTNITEYHDGRAKLGYPTTHRPYDTSDYIEPDDVMLNNTRVRSIRAVYFLNRPETVGQFWNFDNGTSAFTNYTTNVNDTSESDFTLFDASPAVNDIIYIGAVNQFLGLTTDLSTLGTGSPVIDWEYWNGSAWTDITETDVDTGASVFTARGTFTWSMPSSWTRTEVNGSSTLYYIRGTLTTGYTIAPICNSVTIYDAVSEQVHSRDWTFESWGRLSFIGTLIPNGTRNIRIDYTYGETSTPPLIQELSALMAGLRAYVHISGGSFDDVTNYSIGSKNISIGEVYVNVREVLDQFNKRIKTILDSLGRRADVVAI